MPKWLVGVRAQHGSIRLIPRMQCWGGDEGRDRGRGWLRGWRGRVDGIRRGRGAVAGGGPHAGCGKEGGGGQGPDRVVVVFVFVVRLW